MQAITVCVAVLLVRAFCGCGRMPKSPSVGGEQAAGVLAMVKRAGIEAKGGRWPEQEEIEFKQPVLDQFEEQSEPLYVSARLWDDAIINPRDTRRVIALSLSSAANTEIEKTVFPIFRM